MTRTAANNSDQIAQSRKEGMEGRKEGRTVKSEEEAAVSSSIFRGGSGGCKV